jgi:NADH:ubiquinone oxidoreductase subunit D
MLRCTGVKRDLRLDLFETYGNYYYLNFKSFYSKKGDSYDRYLLRMNEMLESLNIINQLIQKLINLKNNKINKNTLMNYHDFNNNSFITSFLTMEQTIKHFKY